MGWWSAADPKATCATEWDAVRVCKNKLGLRMGDCYPVDGSYDGRCDALEVCAYSCSTNDWSSDRPCHR